AFLKAVKAQDPEAVLGRVRRTIAEAEEDLAARHPDVHEDRIRSAAAIAGVSAVMLGMKMVKTLPGLPFAPGHKNAIMLPMYILGRELTGSRFGATSCGVCMGVLAFLTGDGRYGIFEIAKHLAPGVLVDLLYPAVRRVFGVGIWPMSALGVVLATGRFSTEIVVAWLLGAPAAFFAYVGVSGVTHLGAGALSGVVSASILGAVASMRYEATENASATGENHES
ncbi:MAG: hypothetical protein H8D71_00325, partial [Deltaproteobacteria bacterium]|nr:hypothetical protein [Deltaproteobacteria bacterium]